MGNIELSDEAYEALLKLAAAKNLPPAEVIATMLSAGRRYLMLNRDEINEVRSHNHACQLAGTPYWAVMTIDDATKRRFICRLLEFIGCHDETVTQACRALGLLEAPAHGFRLLSVA